MNAADVLYRQASTRERLSRMQNLARVRMNDVAVGIRSEFDWRSERTAAEAWSMARFVVEVRRALDAQASR